MTPTAVSPLQIRAAQAADLAACHRIYVHHVRHGTASFEEIPPTQDEFGARHATVVGQGMPYLVAQRQGMVVGYCYVSPFRARSAYRYTLENSIYVAHDQIGHGIGAALLAALIEQCERGPWRQMIAVIGDSANAASIGLHARFGFEHAGRLVASGFKFGRWVDTVLMQRALGPGASALPDTTGAR